jgi:probable selenium-dependent hydroxylase accessory protein YqeC
MDLVETLAADGLVAVVGAGGKKTTLYTLAARLDRAVVTATTRIPEFEAAVARRVVTADPVEELEAAVAAGDDDWPLGLVPGRADEVRFEGYDTGTVDRPGAAADAAGLDAALVKADGARSRWLKAPDDHEPQIPASADTVLPIASARVVGEPLDAEHVHRPELVAEVTGLASGQAIRPRDVAAVLASEAGGLKGVPDGATVVAVVNMVDDEALRETAREIAAGVRRRSDRVDRIALTRMDEGRVVGTLA